MTVVRPDCGLPNHSNVPTRAAAIRSNRVHHKPAVDVRVSFSLYLFPPSCHWYETLQDPGNVNGCAVGVGDSHLKDPWLRVLSVSSGLLCNFVAVYLTTVQFILQLKLCLCTTVHRLLE